ncbi:MAG: tRNA pseudouridine(38-40) synthase TruA [Bacteroidales bacterium]|jgi:tRNA pseudouridine38-40 synthase
MRLFLQLQYNGSNYHGWQIQPNSNSVQQEIEKGLSLLLQKKISVIGCGRTDTGVHASKYFLHFDLDEDKDNVIKENIYNNTQNFLYKLNGILPEDIKIEKILEPVNEDIHARFSALSRTYNYRIINQKDPFLYTTSYKLQANLDLELMNKASKILYDYSDFSSFAKTGSDNNTNLCKISHANWEKQNHIITFSITADRFLRGMVRAICGTIINVGREKITLDEFKQIIESKNRSNAGMSVPPQGLTLVDVDYGNVFREL